MEVSIFLYINKIELKFFIKKKKKRNCLECGQTMQIFTEKKKLIYSKMFRFLLNIYISNSKKKKNKKNLQKYFCSYKLKFL